MIKEEIWKDIPDYENLYQVSKGKLNNAGGYHWQKI